MANVFTTTPEEDDDEQTPGIRVAGALTGDGGEEEVPDVEPQIEQKPGTVDMSAQSYLTPANADEDQPQEDSQQVDGADVPVSADIADYMKPIAPPTLDKPAAFADHSADTAAMTTQKQAESEQNIKPSVGRRILAGLAGGAVAFGGGDGTGTVEKVLNRPAERAQQQWALQEAPIQAKLNADAAADAATTRANAVTEQNNRLAETNYRNESLGQQNAARAADYQAQAEQRRNAIIAFTPDDPANPYAGGTGTTADGRTIKGVAPPDAWIQRWVKTPDGQSATQQMTLKQRGAAADQIGLKGQDRQDFLANGKISQRVPRQPSAEEIALGQARAAFIRENGRPPQTLEEQNGVTQTAKGTLNGPAGAADPGDVIAKNMQDKQSWVDSLQKQPDGTYVDEKGNTITQKQFDDRLEKFRTDLNADPVMRKSGTMVDAQGRTVTNRFSRNPQTVPPPQAAQPQRPVAPPQPAAPKPPRTPATGLPDNTAARNPRTGQVEWVVKGGQWTPFAQPPSR